MFVCWLFRIFYGVYEFYAPYTFLVCISRTTKSYYRSTYRCYYQRKRILQTNRTWWVVRFFTFQFDISAHIFYQNISYTSDKWTKISDPVLPMIRCCFQILRFAHELYPGTFLTYFDVWKQFTIISADSGQFRNRDLWQKKV